MKYINDDGGRSAAGKKGVAGDCAVRAIAIATGTDYQKVYDAINLMPKTKYKNKGTSNSRTGVYRSTVNLYMESIGWHWVPTMSIGSGCKVHMREDELPKGNIIVRLSRHFAAVLDGILHDTHDCTRDGTRCVYGYWMKG